MSCGPALLEENHIDVLVSFESDWKHMLWFLCCEGTRVPFVCSERITPVLSEQNWSSDGRRLILEKSAAIHELLPCYVKYIPKHLLRKVTVIPNAAPEHISAACPPQHAEPHVLLFLGRLMRQKRPALVLRAFGLLAGEFPDWRLRMAGWGVGQEYLEALARELNLQDRVSIGQADADAAREYAQAGIYCLPTQHEGFPNSVLEAMAAGLPVVGVADCPAMATIIRHGSTGLLADAPTPEALAAALRPLLASEHARTRMGREAWAECHDQYAAQKIFDQWEALLTRVSQAAR